MTHFFCKTGARLFKALILHFWTSLWKTNLNMLKTFQGNYFYQLVLNWNHLWLGLKVLFRLWTNHHLHILCQSIVGCMAGVSLGPDNVEIDRLCTRWFCLPGVTIRVKFFWWTSSIQIVFQPVVLQNPCSCFVSHWKSYTLYRSCIYMYSHLDIFIMCLYLIQTRSMDSCHWRRGPSCMISMMEAQCFSLREKKRLKKNKINKNRKRRFNKSEVTTQGVSFGITFLLPD